MRKYFVVLALVSFFYCHSNESSLLQSYKNSIQRLIDRGESITISTFTDFVNNFEQKLHDESQKYIGLKPYIKKIISFVKTISLIDSSLSYNTVPVYGESFTIEAKTIIQGKEVPLRFTVVSDVHDNEFYALSLKIPDDISITDFMGDSVADFERIFKNRWLTFSLFAYRDALLGNIANGLTITGDVNAQSITDRIPQDLNFIKNILHKTIPSIQFYGSVPLAVLGLIPFVIDSNVPPNVDLGLLQSLITLRGAISVKKKLYNNNEAQSGIKSVELDSYDIIARWGTQSGMRAAGLGSLGNMSLGLGATIRLVSVNGPDFFTHGGFELRPSGPIIYGKVEGELKNPFGIPWISLYDSGFEFPLNPLGTLITGIGLRAQVGLGSAKFEVAGKSSVGFLQKSGLVLHGKVEKITFSSLIDLLKKNNESFLSSLVLDHAQVSLAIGDTVIAEREFKSGMTIKAQVGHSILDKKAGFELFMYNTGTSYQFFGNGYLPVIQTDYITFEHAQMNSYEQDTWTHLGPRVEFDYRFDLAFEKFLMAKIKANGRIKMGSFFDGTADLDLSTINLARNTISDFKNLFVAILRGQKVILKGKIFNTFGAELQILESKDKDIYVKAHFSQTLLSSWEKLLREKIISSKETAEQIVKKIDQQIYDLVGNMNTKQREALDRIIRLMDENDTLRDHNANLQKSIKKIGWIEVYKTVPLRAKQASNWLLIRSNADLINTLTMHAACTESMIEGVKKLYMIKKPALALINCAADIAHVGAGILGIEKVEAHGWLDEIMYKSKQLYLNVELKVRGEKITVSDILLDGREPLESAKRCIDQIIKNMF